MIPRIAKTAKELNKQTNTQLKTQKADMRQIESFKDVFEKALEDERKRIKNNNN